MPRIQSLRLNRNLILHVHCTQDAFDPAKHPRGHQGNVGQFASSGGGSKQQTQQTKPSINQQQQHTTQSGKLTREQLQGDLGTRVQSQSQKQEVTDINDLYDKAKRDEPTFVQSIQQVAESVGGKAEFTPPQFAEPGTTLKSRKSAERKMNGEYNGDASQLRDILRATVVCDKIENVRAAAAQFIEKHKQDIVNVKDRIVKPATGGYRDVLINFRTPSGLISEVQFNAPPMMEAKLGDGHRIYEALRVLQAQPNKRHDRMIEFLGKKSEDIYNKAYQASGNGNWS